MKTGKGFLYLASLVLLCAAPALAQNPVKQVPQKYQMQLVLIADTTPEEFLFVIGSVGFKSVAGLKNFIATLPAGSVLEWSPGCVSFGNEPLLSSEEDLKDFKAFCERKEIKLIIVPSG